MIEATRLLSEFVFNLKYENISEEDIKWTKKLIIDYFAASFAGYKVNKIFNSATERLMFGMGGKEEAYTLLSDKKLPCENAAFMSAVYAHGADMDDGHRKAMGHVAASVISSVFAYAQTLNVSGKDVLTAIVCGYELYIRIASACQPGLVHRAFHSTGTAGAIACAGACAKLSGQSADGIYNSMAIASTQASGLMIIAESGQMIKPINPAKAAQTGIISSKLSLYGVNGPKNPLESEKGFFHSMSDKIDYTMITDGLSEKLLVGTCYYKPYPSCRHTHCGIEAGLNIYKRLNGEKIKKVNVYIYMNAIKIAGQIKMPSSVEDSKFSIHYSLACVLVNGSFSLDDLDVEGASEAVRTLIPNIELVEDASMENRDAGIRGARVEVITESGKILDDTVTIPKGDPEKPFSDEDILKKMSDCSKGVVDFSDAVELMDKIEKIDGMSVFERIWDMPANV